MNQHADHPYTAEEIQRYLKGEMSEAEMHALEKAALDDPMLADAIEGFQASLAERGELTTIQDVEALNRAFHERHHPTPIKSFPFWQVAAAAVIIIIAGVVTFNYFNKPEGQLAINQTDTSSKPVPQKENVFKLPDTTVAASLSDTSPTIAVAPGKQSAKRSANNTTSNTPAVEAADAVSESRKINEDELNAAVKKPTDTVVRTARETAAPQANRDEVASAPSAVKQEANLNAIRGRVVNSNLEPLANAMLTPSDASMQTYNNRQNRLNTDRAGYFNLLSPDTSVVVRVTANGYREQLFRLRNNATENQLVLQPDLKGKAAGISIDKKSVENVSAREVQNAMPEGGWEAFEAYIEKNKVYPAENSNLSGEVKVSFQVNSQGKTSNFKIIQSLAKGFDEEAIRLIKEGPKWTVSKGKRTTVNVAIRF